MIDSSSKRPDSHEPTLEYCMAKYLDQWVHHECELCQNLQKIPTTDSIRDALRYFKVSRSFKGIHSENRVKKVLALLLENDRRITVKTAPIRVAELARSFEENKFTFNISAASKLLWLRRKSPIVIYDSRAVNALSKHLGYKFGKKDYQAYYAAWCEAFQVHRQRLRAIAKRLPEYAEFTALDQSASIKDIASQEWFLERTFDHYLWRLGGDFV